MTNRIRITGRGIFGLINEDNPSGEYPIGHEFDTEGELPAGWVGRAEIVGEGPKEGAVALTNKNKAELLEIAAAEGVTVEDGATNDDIKAAIELAREAK